MAQFYTDFSEYTIGQQPPDWGIRWNSTNVTLLPTVVSGATGNTVLRCSISGGGQYRLHTWDSIGSSVTDVEVAVRVRASSISAGNPFRAFVRAGGDGTQKYGYDVDFYFGNVRLQYYNGTDAGVLASTSYTIANNTWYWLRIRAQGAAISLKVWASGSAEPDTWTLTVTDSRLTSGYVGVGTNASPTTDFDVFGVGTNGDPAPTAPVGGTTPTTHRLALTASMTQSPTLRRSIDKTVSVAMPTTTAVTRGIKRRLTQSLAVSRVLTRSVKRTLTAPTGVAASFIHSLVRGAVTHTMALVASVAPAVSLGRGITKTFVKALDFAPSLRRRVHKIVQASTTLSASLSFRSVRRMVFAVAAGVTLSLKRVVAKTITANVRPDVTVRRNIAKTFVSFISLVSAFVRGGRQGEGRLVIEFLREALGIAFLADALELHEPRSTLEVVWLSTGYGPYYEGDALEFDAEVRSMRIGTVVPANIEAVWTLRVRGESTPVSSGTCTVEGTVATAFVTLPSPGTYILRITATAGTQRISREREIVVK